MACKGCVKRREIVRQSVEEMRAGEIRKALSSVAKVGEHLVKNPPIVRRVVIK